MAEPIKVDVMQYYLDIGDGTPLYVRVTEDTAFNPTVEREEYSPKYKCNKTQPKYAAGKTYGIDVDIDIVDEQQLQEWLILHEDDDNVPTAVVRVRTDLGTASARPARRAEFAWNGNPLDGEANNPLKITGKLNMTSDGWAEGEFDEATKTFTVG
jgi:hypothetical protein